MDANIVRGITLCDTRLLFSSLLHIGVLARDRGGGRRETPQAPMEVPAFFLRGVPPGAGPGLSPLGPTPPQALVGVCTAGVQSF